MCFKDLFVDISSPTSLSEVWNAILNVLEHMDKSHSLLFCIILNHSLSSSRTPLSAPHIHPWWLPWLFSSSLWYMCPWFFHRHLDVADPPDTQTERHNRWINKTSQPSLWILIAFGLCLWIPAQLWCWSVRLPTFQESQGSKYSAHPKGCCVPPWCLSRLFCPYFMWARI